jgi:ATP-dependent DNA ligase
MTLPGSAEAVVRAIRAGLEGVIAKRRDLTFPQGDSRFWLDARCVRHLSDVTV